MLQRERRRPVIFCPPTEPIRARVKRNARKRKTTCETFPPERLPPWEADQRAKVVSFLQEAFGNAVSNEELKKNSPLYRYWDRYARSDFGRSSTFEKVCFICKQSCLSTSSQSELESSIPRIGTEYTNEKWDEDFMFCGVGGCPKLYHSVCLTALLSSECNAHVSFRANDTKFICPWHHCSQCGGLGEDPNRRNYDVLSKFCRFQDSSFGHVYCPCCTNSYCSKCSGFEFPGIRESVCAQCAAASIELNAPEMVQDLTSYVPSGKY